MEPGRPDGRSPPRLLAVRRGVVAVGVHVDVEVALAIGANIDIHAGNVGAVEIDIHAALIDADPVAFAVDAVTHASFGDDANVPVLYAHALAVGIDAIGHAALLDDPGSARPIRVRRGGAASISARAAVRRSGISVARTACLTARFAGVGTVVRVAVSPAGADAKCQCAGGSAQD